MRPLILRLSLLFAMGLSGCGGDEEGGDVSPLPPSPAEQVFAVDGFSVIKPGEPSVVDLSEFVRGRGASLASVTSEQAGCLVSEITGLKAKFTVDEVGACRYDFTVSNGKYQSTAQFNLLSSTDDNPILTPTSYTIAPSAEPTNINLPALLEREWPAGYSLDPDSIQVVDGSVQGTAEVEGNSITYTPPASEDWNRISFVLKDDLHPNKRRLGTVFALVAAAATPPNISNAKLNYSSPVYTNDPKTFDLSTIGANISSSGQWQLVEVQSYTATVASAAPDDVTNKKFTFDVATAGPHVVSYIVGSHAGGFRMGIINFNVVPKENSKTWADITLGGKTYFATPRYSEVKSKISDVTDAQWDSGVNNSIALVTGDMALRYCRTSGYRLATEADLKALWAASATSAEGIARDKYPVLRNYIVSNDDGASFLAYDPATDTAAATTDNQYVMCVKYPGDSTMAYTARPNMPSAGQTNGVISDGVWWPIGDIVSIGGIVDYINPTSITNTGVGTLSAANVRIFPAGCPGGTCVLEAKGDLSETGSLSLALNNARVPSQSLTINPIRFLKNYKIVSSRISANNSPNDNSTSNIIMVKLADKDGNNLPAGTKISLTYTNSGVGSVSPASGSTLFTVDANGEVPLLIKSGSVGASTVTVSLVGGLSGGLASTTQTVNFWINARVVATGGPIAVAGDQYAMRLTLTRADGSAVPAGTGVTITYNMTGNNVTPALASGGSVSVGAGGIVDMVVCRAVSLLDCNVNVNSASVSNGLPFIYTAGNIATQGRFEKPGSAAMVTLTDATNYCAGRGMRLPTQQEISALYVAATDHALPPTTLMCTRYGWPLQSQCGGITSGYWITDKNGSNSMNYDLRLANPATLMGSGLTGGTSFKYMVTCVRW